MIAKWQNDRDSAHDRVKSCQVVSSSKSQLPGEPEVLSFRKKWQKDGPERKYMSAKLKDEDDKIEAFFKHAIATKTH